jgi:predicted transcriptional regulator
MSEKFNPDSFAPFLESMKRAQSRGAPTVPSVAPILKALANAQDMELDTAALLFRVSLPIETLASALKDLEVNGLLRRRIEDGRELIQLTRTGEQVARVQL